MPMRHPDIGPEIDHHDLTTPNQISGSGLATDYLNIFNEAIMASELVSEFPEFLDELKLWKRRTYREHFEHTNTDDKEQVLKAYDELPILKRESFDGLAQEVNDYFEVSIGFFLTSEGQGLNEEIEDRIALMKSMVARLDGLIHGTSVYETNGSQSIIDQMF
jgi:hypothetical protein